MKASAWAISWLAVGLLGGGWYVLMRLAPACDRVPRYTCGDWTDAGVFILGLLVLGAAVLVAVGVSVWSLVRGGQPVWAGALFFAAAFVFLSVL